MDSFETKKLALLRILQIFKQYSDSTHLLKQEDIAQRLSQDYGIQIERKAIGRNVSLLREAGFEIATKKNGSYLVTREFEDSELHMIIDGILCSKYISVPQSKSLIKRITELSNKYFNSRIKYVYSLNDWDKTENQYVFENIEKIDIAISKGKQLIYNYNRYGEDKKLHKSSFQKVSPYQMILHNQRYYLMAYSGYWKEMVFHRLDYITDMKIVSEDAMPLKQIEGYERGINYKELATALPYMYTDKPEKVEFLADKIVISQIIDWFGKDIKIESTEDEGVVKVTTKVSKNAMFHWALQYIKFVEIKYPQDLREDIAKALEDGVNKYHK